jgi:hypothetical protein
VAQLSAVIETDALDESGDGGAFAITAVASNGRASWGA